MTEFELIKQYFVANSEDLSVRLGVGDDAAIVCPSPGCELVVSVDTLVSGRHFFPDVDPFTLGHKTLAVNLSDMAAMGASPRWVLLALTLPSLEPAWLDAFARGFFALANTHGVTLIGGDTTGGPLALSVTVMGEVPTGAALCRHTAQAGDDIWVSGQLGLAALALQSRLSAELMLPAAVRELCWQKLQMPNPQLALGQALRSLVTACIDVSDGLLADAGHIMQGSGVAGELWLEALPACPWLAGQRQRFADVLAAGGDDYELCFTASPQQRQQIAALPWPVSRIGRVVDGQGCRLLDSEGRDISLGSNGFDHFQRKT